MSNRVGIIAVSTALDSDAVRGDAASVNAAEDAANTTPIYAGRDVMEQQLEPAPSTGLHGRRA